MRNPEYLGDGVYAEYLPNKAVKLMTDNHLHPTNIIFLEDVVLESLNNFVKFWIKTKSEIDNGKRTNS